MDIIGPFSKAIGQRKYLLVAVDYFTKWVEAKVVASITTGEVHKFIWKSIISRYGMPRAMVFDNGRQFDSNKLKDYLLQYGCQARFTTVAHPQTNGQAESANKSILSGLRKKLDAAKVEWVEFAPRKQQRGRPYSYMCTAQRSSFLYKSLCMLTA